MCSYSIDIMKKTRKKNIGGSASKTVKLRANIDENDLREGLMMQPISKELFDDSYENPKMVDGDYTGYRMKRIKDDLYELTNSGKYYPKKGGVRTETADVPKMFVYDGYLYKKTEKQTKTGNLKYDRQVLPGDEDFKKEDLDEFADAGDREVVEEYKEPVVEEYKEPVVEEYKEPVVEEVPKLVNKEFEKVAIEKNGFPNIPVITKELFDDSYENPNKVDGDYTGYRMKHIKDDLYELTNSGKYYPKKGGVRTETADVLMMFVYDGYLYKKNEKQTKTGNLRYTREKLPSEDKEPAAVEEEDKEPAAEEDKEPAEEDKEPAAEDKEHAEEDKEPAAEEDKAPVLSERATIEKEEYEYKKEHPTDEISITINGETITQNDDFLYPSLNDPYLNVKIAGRKEFSSYKYDGAPDNIKTRSDYVCREDREFELLPHQLFVKNFLSKNTPYRSILLYHGLGSGKTCSAIGICETMRTSMKQTGVVNKILIIASTNVQDNFKLQLFDDQKLKRSQGGSWTMDSCVGNSMLREINPTNDINITAEKIASQANSIINGSYAFMGYLQFANYVQKRALSQDENATYTEKQKRDIKINNIKRLFNNRLIVIDEVHNVPNSLAAPLLLLIAEHAENVRFVMLSATPMYNSVEEIIWITNLMNANDKRQPIRASDVFDKKGNMREPDGKNLLRRKLNGYISYVRGENPYTFPFRLYPDIFNPDNTFLTMPYPTKTITGNNNLPPMQGMKNRIFITRIGSEQERAYNFITKGANIFTKKSSANIFRSVDEDDDTAIYENMESFGYTKLQVPLQSLIMTFPSPALDKLNGNYVDVDPDTAKEIISELVGKNGINRAMSFKEERKQVDEETFIYMKHRYEYKKGYEGLFSIDKLRAHSSKIAHICDLITENRTTGIIMIYTQYIDGGIVPMALALEELGFARYGSNQQFVKPLFKKGAATNQEPRDAKTMQLRPEYAKTRDLDNFKQAKYMILSGDKYFSQNNAKDIKYATSKANRDGEDVRVILISRAASEGLDFKFIRQVHVLDPWYNLNRIEQIIGRGVRNMSHCGLPFEERNVEIYLHATALNTPEECVDHYVYRYAENKAITIGKVTRLLKEVSVDCELNLGQTQFTYAELSKIPENQNVQIHPSSAPVGTLINIQVGDKTGTEACDYADTCSYTCSVDNKKLDINPIGETYGIEQMRSDSDRLIDALKNIFKLRTNKKMYYHTDEIKMMMAPYMKNEEQLMLALTQIVDNPYEKVFDKYGREGKMVNRGDVYAFQPLEVTDKRASLLENVMPVNFKHDKLNYAVSKELMHMQGSPTSPMSPMMPMSPMSPFVEGLWMSAIEDLRKNMEIVRRPEPYPVMASEEDWAKNLNSISTTVRLTGAEKDKRRPLIDFFLISEHGFTRPEIEKYAFEHFMDTMNHRLKKSLIENLSLLNETDELEYMILRYFKVREFSYKQSVGYIFTKVSKNIVKNVILYRETPETTWTEEEPGEMLDFKKDIQDRLMMDLTHLNNTFGFVGYFTGRGIKEKGSAEGTMEYMTKTLGRGRGNTGAKLSGKGKDVIITIYNSIMDTIGLPEHHYVEKEIKDISKNGFAVVLELLLRKYQDEHKKGLIWHLTPEETIANRIVEYDI